MAVDMVYFSFLSLNLYVKTDKGIRQQTKNPWSIFTMKLDDQISLHASKYEHVRTNHHSHKLGVVSASAQRTAEKGEGKAPGAYLGMAACTGRAHLVKNKRTGSAPQRLEDRGNLVLRAFLWDMAAFGDRTLHSGEIAAA